MAMTRTVVIRNLQRKLYLRSKQKPSDRFYSLYDKIYREDILLESYYMCKRNRGCAGPDGLSFDEIEKQGLKDGITNLSVKLRSKSYQAQPVKRVYIDKPGGGKRPLGIPSISCRVVQMACKIVMEPIFEANFTPTSYGYRPIRSASQACQEIHSLLKQGYTSVYDADLSKYFDTIPHEVLLSKIERKISHHRLLNLLREFLKAPVQIEENAKIRLEKSRLGTPQGGVLSPLLSVIYLDDFNKLIHERTPCKIISYADDFVILHQKPYTNRQLNWFRERLESEGLTLKRTKTRAVDMKERKSTFDFLGFCFRNQYVGRLGKWLITVSPSLKSQKKLKDRIRSIVKHRSPCTLEELIVITNRVLRGWKNYFSALGYPRDVFFRMDWFVVARFYRWAKRLSQRESKHFLSNALRILKQKGLLFLVPPTRTPVKGLRRRNKTEPNEGKPHVRNRWGVTG